MGLINVLNYLWLDVAVGTTSLDGTRTRKQTFARISFIDIIQLGGGIHLIFGGNRGIIFRDS
jgi:hypothetical protein